MRLQLLLAAALVATTTQAAAADLTASTSGYVYFHRASATLAEHDADVRACMTEAQKTNQPDTSAGAGAGGGLLGALVVGIVKGVMNGIAERRGTVANLENCMVVRGWSVRRLNDADGAAITALPQPGQAEKLAALVGATEPVGPPVRVYANDAQLGATAMFTPARDLDKVPLSYTALTPIPKGEEPPIGPIQNPAKMKKSAYPPKALKPEQLAAVPADAALVVVRLTGGQLQGGEVLTFERASLTPRTPSWADGQPGAFYVALPLKMFAKRDQAYDVTAVFALPPGQWRLSSAARGLFLTSFCLGQPEFTVAKGETVHAGTFTLGDERIGPDLDLAPAKTALAALPDRVAALKPAAYVNGATSECGGVYVYALEVPGAPFVEGYRYGSALKAQAVSTEAKPAATPVETPAEAPASAEAPAPTAPTAPTGVSQ
jgi:hypothetical protein